MASADLTSATLPREFSSWVRKYFKIIERQVKNIKTGIDSLVKFDSCQLTKCDTSGYEETCGKGYKHCIKNGTKNLIRLILTEHRNLEEIKGEIIANKLEGCKVRNNQ